MARRAHRDTTPPSPARRAVDHALQPFVGVSAFAGALLITGVGLLFLVPLWVAQGRDWTGAGVGVELWVLAPVMFAVLYASSRFGVRIQLRPLAEVAAALKERLDAGEPRVQGRIRRGWGASVELPLVAGEAVRVVAARGQRSRPDLYLVRGEQEYRFQDVRKPLPELDEALKAVGLS